MCHGGVWGVTVPRCEGKSFGPEWHVAPVLRSYALKAHSSGVGRVTRSHTVKKHPSEVGRGVSRSHAVKANPSGV